MTAKEIKKLLAEANSTGRYLYCTYGNQPTTRFRIVAVKTVRGVVKVRFLTSGLWYSVTKDHTFSIS